MRRTLVAVAVALLMLFQAPAHAADDGWAECQKLIDEYTLEHQGTFDLPTCVVSANGQARLVGNGSSFDSGSGIPGWFGFLAFLMIAIGIGTTIWRVSVARNAARRAGMDPDEATAMTLLSDNGLEATYLTSQLRQTLTERDARMSQGDAGVAGDERTVTERLAELDSLKQRGIVTEQEYAAKRAEILEDL